MNYRYLLILAKKLLFWPKIIESWLFLASKSGNNDTKTKLNFVDIELPLYYFLARKKDVERQLLRRRRLPPSWMISINFA